MIVGAQIAGSDDGITGQAVNFNGALNTASDFVNTQSFQTDVSDQPFKIQNIGFITTTTTAQNADLTFNVTIQDGDGDKITQTLDATVTSSADSSTPISLSGSVVTIQSPVNNTSSVNTLSLASSTDTEKSSTQQTTTNSNSVLMGAFAAAGLAASEPLAAEDNHSSSQSVDDHALDAVGQHTEALTPVALDAVSGDDGLNIAAIASDGHSEAAPASAAVHGAGDDHAQTGIDSAASQAGAHAPAELPQGTDAPAHDSGVSAAAITAGGIAMPDAALLMAAAAAHGGVAGQAPTVDGQHNEVVGKVLADALHGGGSGPNVEALLNSLPQAADHGQAAADALASHAAGAVPNGDMGIFAGFTGGIGLHMMQQMAVHADAPPTHA